MDATEYEHVLLGLIFLNSLAVDRPAMTGEVPPSPGVLRLLVEGDSDQGLSTGGGSCSAHSSGGSKPTGSDAASELIIVR